MSSKGGSVVFPNNFFGQPKVAKRLYVILNKTYNASFHKNESKFGGAVWVGGVHCYLEFNLSYLKNLIMFFSIWITELFEPIVLWKEKLISTVLAFLTSFSWKTKNLSVKLCDVLVKTLNWAGKSVFSRSSRNWTWCAVVNTIVTHVPKDSWIWTFIRQLLTKYQFPRNCPNFYMLSKCLILKV